MTNAVGTSDRPMAEFFAMGGYAWYVWPSYGIAAAVLVGLLVASVRGLRGQETTLKALEGARPRRRPRANTGNGTGDAAGRPAAGVEG